VLLAVRSLRCLFCEIISTTELLSMDVNINPLTFFSAVFPQKTSARCRDFAYPSGRMNNFSSGPGHFVPAAPFPEQLGAISLSTIPLTLPALNQPRPSVRREGVQFDIIRLPTLTLRNDSSFDHSPTIAPRPTFGFYPS